MIGPNGKRKWWVLGMAVLVLAGSALGSGRQALAPAVEAAEAATTASNAALTRTLVFPAYSMSFPPESTIITRDFEGLSWKKLNESALLAVPRPLDWDGSSAVQIRLFFRAPTYTSGTVAFFVRPRVYNSGDTWHDAAGVASDLVSVSGPDKYYQMTVSIPAASFGTKSWWYLVFQRSLSTPTYPDEVRIISVAIDYTALSPLTSVALPVVSK